MQIIFYKDKLCICVISSTTLAFLIYCIFFLRKNYLLLTIIFIVSYIIFIISYIYTVLINPGIPGKQYSIEYFKNKKIDDKNYWQKCSKCYILIPKKFNVVHCNKCQVCVREQDHHCPWTGKCIGKYNLKSFYIFVNSLMIYLIMLMVTFIGFMFYNSNLKMVKIKKI